MDNVLLPSSSRLLRLSQIIGPGNPIPVSKSTWWQGIKDGRFPKPTKLGPRITVWRFEDIKALVEAAGAPAIESR